MQSQNTISITEWYNKHHNKPITSLSSVLARSGPNMSIAEYAAYKNYGSNTINTAKNTSTSRTIRKYIPSSKTLENVGIGLGTAAAAAGTGLLAFNAANWYRQKKITQNISDAGNQQELKIEEDDRSDVMEDDSSDATDIVERKNILFYVDISNNVGNIIDSVIFSSINTVKDSIGGKYNYEILFSDEGNKNEKLEKNYDAVYNVVPCKSLYIYISKENNDNVARYSFPIAILDGYEDKYNNILFVVAGNNILRDKIPPLMISNNQPELFYKRTKLRHIKYVVNDDGDQQYERDNDTNIEIMKNDLENL